jgi:hypothetical protein
VCHQSVGLAARALEAAGSPTVTLTSAWSITERVLTPRALFVDAPLGHTAGPPHEPDVGRGIVEMALGVLDLDLESGAIVDSGYRWPTDDWKAAPLQWSRRSEERSTQRPENAATADSRTERSDEPQYQNDDDRRAAESGESDRQA